MPSWFVPPFESVVVSTERNTRAKTQRTDDFAGGEAPTAGGQPNAAGGTLRLQPKLCRAAARRPALPTDRYIGYLHRAPPAREAHDMPATEDSLTTFMMERPLHYLWGLVADLAIALYTIVCGSLAVLGVFICRAGWPVDVLSRIWCNLIVWTCGIRI